MANSKRNKSPHEPSDVLDDLSLAIEHADQARGFSPDLSWSHYRTLLSVESKHERLFYEIEAAKENWSVPQLTHQIHTCLFARLLKSQDKAGVLAMANEGHEVLRPVDAIKHPYVLDFLDLPKDKALHESDLDAAIMDKLQPFLLELGKGFAFVSRQHRITAALNRKSNRWHIEALVCGSMIVALMGLKQMAIYARQVGFAVLSPEKIMDWISDDISRRDDPEKFAAVPPDLRHVRRDVRTRKSTIIQGLTALS